VELVGVDVMNNYQKIMSMRPFDLIDILARSCPTNEDMINCYWEDGGYLDKKRACRRCWNEWLSSEVKENER